MQAEDIERYLVELGEELHRGGVQKPIHILLIGGAYMLLLLRAPRTTDDVDFFWLEEEEETLEQAIYALRDGVQTVAEKHQLEIDWFNYMTHLLMYDQVNIPKGKLWKRFGPLHVHVPPYTSMFRQRSIFLHLKLWQDVRRISRIVSFCFDK